MRSLINTSRLQATRASLARQATPASLEGRVWTGLLESRVTTAHLDQKGPMVRVTSDFGCLQNLKCLRTAWTRRRQGGNARSTHRSRTAGRRWRDWAVGPSWYVVTSAGWHPTPSH